MVDSKLLTEIDFQLLEYVQQSDGISFDDLVKNFRDRDTTEFRINQLAEGDLQIRPHGFISVQSSSYLSREFRGNDVFFHITPIGKRALEDWKFQKDRIFKKLMEDRFLKIAPILISMTALILSVLALLQSLGWIDISRAAILPLK